MHARKAVLAMAFAVALGLGAAGVAFGHDQHGQGGPSYGQGMPGYGMGPGMMGPGMMGPGMMGPGMMGPGMMGPGMMGPGYGRGPVYGTCPYGMGPGMMMEPGYGMGYGMGHSMMMRPCPYGMGPGMMNGPAMMGPGYGMGPGTMMGPGYGYGMRRDMGGPDRDLDAEHVRRHLERQLAWQGNPRLKVGAVAETDDDTIVAEIVTQDGSLVQKLEIDRHSGFMRQSE